MITDMHKRFLQRWFYGLERGDTNGLLELFAGETWIRNAGDAPMQGSDAAQRFLTEFFSKTTARRFTFIDAALERDQLFASWDAELTFTAGFRMKLRGIDRFQLDVHCRIEQLHIVQTMSNIDVPAQLGQQAR